MLALEIGLITVLHWSANSTYAIPLQSLGDWLRTADPAVSLVAVARIIALGIGYWLLVTTVLYAAAHYLGWQSMTSALRWITLPVVRRVVQGVTAMSLTGASIVGPAALSVTPALAQETVVVQSEIDETTTEGSVDGETITTDYRPDAAGWPATGANNDFWFPAAVSQTQATGDYVVKAGDHFWSIAESHLRTTVGRDVTEDEVCQYWVRLVDANRSTIRSGDPDLIYPDEAITLPSVFSE